MIEIQFDMGTAQDIMNGELFGRIKTRDGKPVRIICWNAKGNYPIVALVDMGSFETPISYTNDGKNDYRDNVTTNLDLIIETEGGNNEDKTYVHSDAD